MLTLNNIIKETNVIVQESTVWAGWSWKVFWGFVGAVTTWGSGLAIANT